jgi:hypothetical protein
MHAFLLILAFRPNISSQLPSVWLSNRDLFWYNACQVAVSIVFQFFYLLTQITCVLCWYNNLSCHKIRLKLVPLKGSEFRDNRRGFKYCTTAEKVHYIFNTKFSVNFWQSLNWCGLSRGICQADFRSSSTYKTRIAWYIMTFRKLRLLQRSILTQNVHIQHAQMFRELKCQRDPLNTNATFL